MNFDTVLSQVTELLREERRISYRGLKRRFEIDDATLEDIKAELIDARRVAADEDGKVLVLREPPPAPVRREAALAGEKPSQDSRTASEAAPRKGYTPPHLLQAVLKNRTVMEGERKQVTVVFCDVAGSTELAQRLGEESMHTAMDRVLRLAAEVVHHHGGTVNQYLGDGLMALFGAPIALEDHAVRAVHAALAIHEALAKENLNFRREYDVEIRLRIGVNTGPVVVGRIGDDLRMDYTASGNTTHIAERMQGLAEPGTALICEDTCRLVEGHVEVEALGPMMVKGQHEPVRVYRLIKRLPRRNRFEVLASRGLTPLAGRGSELSLLAERLELARTRRGQAVGIVGEAGVGKSRLVHEFARSLASADVIYAVGQCSGETQSTPYVPVIEVFRTLFRIDDADDPETIREKVRRGLDELGPTLSSAAPLLDELLAPGGDVDQLSALDPSTRRKRILEALLAVTSAVTEHRPMVVVIEDLHWIDPSSEHSLNGLVKSFGALPILLVTTHRPGYAVPWAASSHYTQMAVEVLAATEAENMVSSILGGATIPHAVRRIVHDRAGGNPLFMEELLRSIVQRGLVKSDAAAGPENAVAVEFPSTVHDILRARLDEIDAAIKRTVQAASAIGQVFGVELLSRLADVGADLEQALNVSNEMGLIREHRFFPEIEYAFKHAVVQEVAYQSLLAPRRRELHGHIGREMETLWRERVDEYLDVLAYHFSRSDDHEKAFTYSMRAGDRAERLYARAEATTQYLTALAHARALPHPKASQQGQIDAIVSLAAVAHTREHMDRDAGNLETAQSLADQLDDKHRLARVLYWRGRLSYSWGAFADALAYAQRSIAIADDLGDEALAAPPVNLVARLRWQQGDYGKAAQLLARSTEQMRRLGNRAEEATAAGFAGWTLAFLGQVADALEYTERGLRLARELQHPFSEAAAHFYRGAVFDQQGAWQDALAEYAAARRIAHDAGDTFREYLVMCQEGRAYAMAGDVERGKTTLRDALALAETLGTAFVLGWPRTYLAQCLLELGDTEAARSLAEEALKWAEQAGDKYARFAAHRALAAVLAAQPAPDYARAEEELRHSIRLQHEMGIKPELGRTYLQYADLCRRRGDTAEARAYLNVAIDVFRQQEMRWDLERADRLLRQWS
jgi:class 3 adenylate cyclase/tetratricopeptide (TPR) repeat protein